MTEFTDHTTDDGLRIAYRHVAVPGLDGDPTRAPGDMRYGKVKIVITARPGCGARITAWPLSRYTPESGADMACWKEQSAEAFERTDAEWVRVIQDRVWTREGVC